MTIQELKDLVRLKIAGQGTNVDAGGALPPVLNGILDTLAATQNVDSVEVTVDEGIGTPSADVTFTDGVLTIAFHNLKGEKGDKGDQGNTGSSVDYPFELVNNLTTDDATKALSAAQGVVLDGKISQLGQDVTELDLGEVVENQYVSTNGTFPSYNGYQRTDFISISGIKNILVGTGVKANGVAAIAFYSNNNTSSFISAVNSGDYNVGSTLDLEVPENARYFALCWFPVANRSKVFVRIKSVPATLQNIGKVVSEVESLNGEVESLNGEVESLNGEVGIVINETRSGLHYQDIHIPAGANYKITLISGGRVNIYTYTNTTADYIEQGILNSVGDTITLNTTNEIKHIAIYPLTEVLDNSCIVYKTGGIEERVNTGVNTLNTEVNTLNTEVNTLNTGIATPFTLIDNGYVIYSTGGVSEASLYKYTDYIPCRNFASISYYLAYADSAGIAFYNKEKQYIRGYAKSSSETIGDLVTKQVPEDAYFARISVLANKVASFFVRSLDNTIMAYVSKSNADQLEYGLGTLQNGFINYNDGSFNEASSYRSTDFIRLIGEKIKYRIYFKDSAGVAFYNEEKSFVSGIGNSSGASAYGSYNEVTIPDNAVYVRYCGLASYKTFLFLQCVNDGSLLDLLNGFSPNPTPSEVNPCFYKESSGCRTYKKILCIGDSLTQGTFEYRDGGSTLTYFVDESMGFPAYLKCLTGRDTTNKGDGGQTTKTWWERHQNDDLSGHDACIIALGRNDYAAGRETTTAERYEYMGYIINKVRTENPQIKVFVATMLNYYTGADADAVNADMRGIATQNNCYLVDISAYGKLTFANDAYSHLTAEGYEKVANYYFNYISYIMAQNPADFKNIQFIGTEHYY